MRCFPGATVSDMESYAIPTVRTDPSEIILHVGTNDLRNRSPREVAEDIINLCEDISQNTTASVTISGLTHRTDEPSMGDKVTETNRIIKSFVSGRDLSFIDNSEIGSSMLNSSGLWEPSSVYYARLLQTDIPRELWEVMKNFFGGRGGGNRFIASEKLINVYLLWPIRYWLNKKSNYWKKINSNNNNEKICSTTRLSQRV